MINKISWRFWLKLVKLLGNPDLRKEGETMRELTQVYNLKTTKHFETSGSDFVSIMALNKKRSRKIWTVVDSDDGNYYALAGLHFVNRLFYVISQEAYNSKDEIYFY